MVEGTSVGSVVGSAIGDAEGNIVGTSDGFGPIMAFILLLPLLSVGLHDGVGDG